MSNMNTLYDLHAHSTWSDGDHAPDVVAFLAKRKKLHGVILTDHDTLAGWPVFARSAKKSHLATIQGLEVSSVFNHTDIHILAYSTDFKMARLRPLLNHIKHAASTRMKKVSKKLARTNIAHLDIEMLDRKKGATTHLTKYDLIQELVRSHGIPFLEAQKMIERDGIAYVPYNRRQIPNPKTVITAIHRAGGIAVLAHPSEMLKRTNHTLAVAKTVMQSAIKQLITHGIDGIEVYTPRHSPDQIKEFLNLARTHNLIVTGGSDFHGAIHAPQRPVGSGGIDTVLWEQFIKRLPKKT